MSSIILAVISLLLLHYLIFLAYLRRGLNRLRTSGTNAAAEPSLSVIIPFRNEAAAITASAASISGQTYPPDKWEAIYVDDSSTDNSAGLLMEAVKGNANISLLRATGAGGKKNAISQAITAAKGEIIVTTDADCVHHPDWLKTTAAMFDERTGFVAGPVTYSPAHTLFAKMQQYDFAGLVLTGAGFIGNRAPVICNGANVAYRRELFNRIGGFASGSNLASGDDELIMKKIHELPDYDVAYCFRSGAVTVTAPSPDLRAFFMQRQRWASKSPHYRTPVLFGIMLPVFLFYCVYILLFLHLITNPGLLSVGLLLPVILLKAAAEHSVLVAGNKVFRINPEFSISIITSIVQPVYIIISTIAGVLVPYQWKERTHTK